MRFEDLQVDHEYEMPFLDNQLKPYVRRVRIECKSEHWVDVELIGSPPTVSGRRGKWKVLNFEKSHNKHEIDSISPIDPIELLLETVSP